MTDVEVAIQLALTELDQVLERLTALADQLDPDDDAAQLFGIIVPPIDQAMREETEKKHETGPIGDLFDATELLNNIYALECWSYRDILRMVVALKLLIKVVKEEG